ncbi:capsule assembly Wzi family protein [Dyadobacter sp. CY323]|uniref:capsule assembly Wzi family protein n=1 Tax=Dyadobacter sp. CY323 TaxID=2907302 RepID=UPI001F254E0A|nr:capsule assembly Wzi family protein [Dyadobacter sp. CY323]MCE6992419.1 capsule assembly Wzi family protein [Dyadobacter sp. CY323]
MPLLRTFAITAFLVTVLCSEAVFAQSGNFKSALRGSVEAGGFVSDSDNTPFWIRTNQFGIIPNSSPGGIVQGEISKKYMFFDSLSNRPRKLDWSAALNPVATFDKSSKQQFLLPEAFASVRFKRTELYIGRRKELMGLGDSTLSSGFYSGSGNALPIPKIQIGTISYVPLKFTKSFLAIHAGFAHGWFNTSYLDGVRLHQKFLYFRLGKPKSASKFYLGLNHNVLWAGHSEALKAHPELAVDGKLPSSWKFYPNVVLAYTSNNWFEKNGYGSFDSYRLGNHLGSYDVGFETNIHGKKLFIYHQHPFEDVSSMLLKNVPDGLYGVNLKFGKPGGLSGFFLTHLTFEYLTTKDQSGSTFFIPGSKYQGADNYFNHTQYQEGWSYEGRTVGTPFIIPSKDMGHSRANDRFFPNNRLNMWYLGAQAQVRKSLALSLRTSYSRNFGTPGADFNPVRGQFSSLLAAQYQLPRLKSTAVIVRFALDQGEIFTKNTGAYMGLKKTW